MNLTARDYAKFGRLILNKGNWQGKQLVSKEWVETNLNLENRKATDGYKNQWWSNQNSIVLKDSVSAQKFVEMHPDIISKNQFRGKDSAIWTNVYYYEDGIHAQGLIGQYIYISPKKNSIIVLLSNTLNPDQPLKKGGIDRIKRLLESNL